MASEASTLAGTLLSGQQLALTVIDCKVIMTASNVSVEATSALPFSA